MRYGNGHYTALREDPSTSANIELPRVVPIIPYPVPVGYVTPIFTHSKTFFDTVHNKALNTASAERMSANDKIATERMKNQERFTTVAGLKRLFDVSRIHSFQSQSDKQLMAVEQHRKKMKLTGVSYNSKTACMKLFGVQSTQVSGNCESIGVNGHGSYHQSGEDDDICKNTDMKLDGFESTTMQKDCGSDQQLVTYDAGCTGVDINVSRLQSTTSTESMGNVSQHPSSQCSNSLDAIDDVTAEQTNDHQLKETVEPMDTDDINTSDQQVCNVHDVTAKTTEDHQLKESVDLMDTDDVNPSDKNVCIVKLYSHDIEAIKKQGSVQSGLGKEFVWIFPWKSARLLSCDDVLLFDQNECKISHKCRILRCMTIDTVSSLATSKAWNYASRQIRQQWKSMLKEAKSKRTKLFEWFMIDIKDLKQPLAWDQHRRAYRCVVVNPSVLTVYRDFMIPRMDLMSTAAWMIDRLTMSETESLKQFAYNWHNRTIRLGTTCSGTDICAVVLRKTLQCISERFGVTGLQSYIIIYIYIYLSI